MVAATTRGPFLQVAEDGGDRNHDDVARQGALRPDDLALVPGRNSAARLHAAGSGRARLHPRVGHRMIEVLTAIGVSEWFEIWG